MLLSLEQLTQSAKIHPDFAELLLRNPPPSVDYSDHVALRHNLAIASKMMVEGLGPAPPNLSESNHDVLMRDGFTSTLKIQKPTAGPAGPLVALIFGGGFVAGDKDQLTQLGRLLVAVFGASVVLVGYRVAPEYKFPTAQLDSWDSMIWAAENATSSIINADPTKGFIIGGVSAGGSIAGALSRKFQEQPLAHPLTGQWLCIPSLMDGDSCPAEFKAHFISDKQNTDAPGLPADSREMMAKAAEWDVKSDLRFAVLSKTPLADQPRTYTQVDGLDPLRDDGLIYDELLKRSGVDTRIDLYEGCPHGHFVSMRGTEIADRAMIDFVVGMGWLLRSNVSREFAAKVLGIKSTWPA